MYFTVLDVGVRLPANVKSRAFLASDNWDDWFKYSTLYSLVVVDAKGEIHNIGGIKIGQFAMGDDQRRPELPEKFDGGARYALTFRTPEAIADFASASRGAAAMPIWRSLN